MEDCSLRQKWREEKSVTGIPVSLLLGSREVAGGGAKKDLRDRYTNLVVVRGKGDIDLEGNHGRCA